MHEMVPEEENSAWSENAIWWRVLRKDEDGRTGRTNDKQEEEEW